MKELGSKTIMFLEVIILLKILMTAPATNAVSERSASQLRRVKTWLRTTMSQERLNYLCYYLFYVIINTQRENR